MLSILCNRRFFAKGSKIVSEDDDDVISKWSHLETQNQSDDDLSILY